MTAIDTSASVMGSGYNQAGATASLLQRMSGGKGKMSMAQIDAVSKDFESMFVGQMLEPMFGESVGSDFFGDTESSDVYKGMMADAYGKTITQAGGIGIASYIKQELLKLQEVSQ